MAETLPTLLPGWETFYLLTGTAGATLAGLLFVAASLGARQIEKRNLADWRAFTDPPLLAFALNLMLAALLLVPTLQAAALEIAFLLIGLLVLVYSVSVVRRLWRFSRQNATFDLTDWLWTIVSPVASGLLILAVSLLMLLGKVALGLDTLAFTALLLLTSGVRNTWDLMVWIVSHGAGEG